MVVLRMRRALTFGVQTRATFELGLLSFNGFDLKRSLNCFGLGKALRALAVACYSDLPNIPYCGGSWAPWLANSSKSEA